MNSEFAQSLPDFSKGERARPVLGRSFEPLFPVALAEDTPIEWSSFDGGAGGGTEDEMDLELPEVSMPEISLDDVAMEDVPIEDVAMDEIPVDLPDSPAELISPIESEIILADEPVEGLISLGDDIMDDLNDDHEEQLEEPPTAHHDEVVEQLKELHAQVIDGVAEKVEAMLAAVLVPLAQDRISQAGVDAMVGEISLIVKKNAIECLNLKGPQPLTTAVLDAMGDVEFRIDVEEADTIDLTAEINGQLLSTCIADWSRQLESMLVKC